MILDLSHNGNSSNEAKNKKGCTAKALMLFIFTDLVANLNETKIIINVS